MTTTRDLARKLNLIEKISVKTELQNGCHAKQIFDFLFVLDFESTCWNKSESKCPPEIIEFSVVLYNIKLQEIIAEFQQYVMPIENPKLSNFCTNFTGIQQSQVDNGVPLATNLMLFNKWMNQQQQAYNLTFVESSLKNLQKRCAFVTWSDWDLNICLKNECRRKGINKNVVFNKWIDLRALYREYYQRKPSGLLGALNEMEMEFLGTPHSGICDARNTAYLAGKMMSNGVLLRITKDLNILLL